MQKNIPYLYLEENNKIHQKWLCDYFFFIWRSETLIDITARFKNVTTVKKTAYWFNRIIIRCVLYNASKDL